MLKKVFLLFGEIIVAFSILSTKHVKSESQFERQSTEEDFNINATGGNIESTQSSKVNETLFWTLPDSESTTESIVTKMDIQEIEDFTLADLSTTEDFTSNKPTTAEPPVNADEPTSENKNYEVAAQISDDSFQTSDKIILQRNKCRAEIAIHENSDTKLAIQFGPLQNDSNGTCHVTLTGHENVLLGVVISNVHLHQNNTYELLKVIVGDQYSTFVLKEYYGSNDYEPLLLTETNKVYLILYYKVQYTPQNQDNTHFNLQVFTYRRYEDNYHARKEHKSNYNNFYSSESYVDEGTSYFTPYIYDRIY